MPASIKGWLKEVVEHNFSRPILRMERVRPLHSLVKSIENAHAFGKPAIIAEYKRRSPSGLYADLSYHDYVRVVEKHVVGMSVLTEELYFGGSYRDLIAVASMTDSPVLMKDFIVCERQVDVAYSIGADAILLIATILTDKELEKLYEYANHIGLEAVIEVHDEQDLEKALTLKPKIIGVNARNLRTLEVSLSKAFEILEKVPRSCIKIAESGIKSRRDIEDLMRRGANAFLIGTELMKNPLKIFELVKI
jgi:indole-3-glycerol phosphate synthase (EC 4.1.1.48)